MGTQQPQECSNPTLPVGNGFGVGNSREKTGDDEFEIASRIGVSLDEVRVKNLKTLGTQQPDGVVDAHANLPVDDGTTAKRRGIRIDFWFINTTLPRTPQVTVLKRL